MVKKEKEKMMHTARFERAPPFGEQNSRNLKLLRVSEWETHRGTVLAYSVALTTRPYVLVVTHLTLNKRHRGTPRHPDKIHLLKANKGLFTCHRF